MNEFRALMDRFWVTKADDNELYVSLKRTLPDHRRFIQEQLGWNLIVNEAVIKLEKIPPRPMSWMGIQSFQDPMDYCLLCVVLLFLADLDDGAPFLLSSLTKAVETFLAEIKPVNWTQFLHRKSLVRVLQYAQEIGLVAVLSAEATSDPHALDGGTVSGKLFLHLLAFHSGSEFPGSAEQRDRLYYDNGILCDSISSLVTQVGLVLGTEAGEHPAYRTLRQRSEICTLSLASLSGLTGAKSSSGRAYIVENEMVFAQLCDRAAQFSFPLICTSGQPSVAALRLLDLLAESGTALFYSGDFDGKGLSIAAQLCARYPDHLKPWHMTVEDYDRCRSNISLSDASQSLLQGCAGTVLEKTAQLVGQHRRAGYQELLIPQLEADLIETP